jgi:peptidyl-prolyl cis-trans isomerase B (cyclophilin B)
MVAVACPGVRTRHALLGLIVAVGLTACGDDDDGQESADVTAAAGCADVDLPAPGDDGGATVPTDTLDPAQTWTLTFDTSCGTFVVTLDLDSAPSTAASLVALAESGFYDDTVFHRIVPGFVVQGGDPTQSGSGGPGYQTVDVPADGAVYTHGVVAMAKAGPEPPGTAGSQFFVVTGTDVGLPPEYAIVGEVTDGLDVVDLIGTLGDPATERPTQAVVIESVAAASEA